MNASGEREPNRLKQKLAEGRVCIGATISTSSPVIAEILSHMDFDWLWLETEHTALSLESVLTMLQAANGSSTTMAVRVPWNDRTMIKRVLDTGPDAVIVPLVNTAAEAEAAVRAMKYPPWGERGAGLSRAQCYGLHMEEYMRTADREVLTILMIEHIEAVKNIDSILAVPGVDAVFIGALDLSGSMGMLGQTSHPEVEAAIQRVLAACRRTGMPCGAITGSVEQAHQRIEQGFRLLIVGIDVLFMIGAAKNMLEQVAHEAAHAPALVHA